jgi:hypothetical protein
MRIHIRRPSAYLSCDLLDYPRQHVVLDLTVLVPGCKVTKFTLFMVEIKFRAGKQKGEGKNKGKVSSRSCHRWPSTFLDVYE